MIPKINDIINEDDVIKIAGTNRDNFKVVPDLSIASLNDHDIWLYAENNDAICSIIKDDHAKRIVVGKNVHPTRFKVISNDETIVCFFTNENNDIHLTIINDDILNMFSLANDGKFPVISHILPIAQVCREGQCIAAILAHTICDDGSETLEIFMLNSKQEPPNQITVGDRALMINTTDGQRLIDLCPVSFDNNHHAGAVAEAMLNGELCNALYLLIDAYECTFSVIDLDNDTMYDNFKDQYNLKRKHPIREDTIKDIQ